MGRFRLNQNIDIIVAFGIICIVLMIIIPLPSMLLDILLSINIALSILILLLTLLTKEILDLSVFPTLLLITTLFRLGLNISSTRLILSNGYAGEIIQSFGSFVVGGNYIVGIIIFFIIVIIQFVVITNGSGRVSEVCARFTLDALPGKQMSIDADLNTGTINDEQAKKRRKDLQNEADFYGAMDGASKFVKGDAIAGIIITAINILGGIVIGVLMLKMDIVQSIQTYTVLSIGDGLVTQVPALLISTSSGILVTRSSSEESFGSLLGTQLTAVPKAIAITSLVLILMAIIPGLPKVPFIIISVICAVGAYILYKKDKTVDFSMDNIDSDESKVIEYKEDLKELIKIEPIEVELGYGLIPLADEFNGGDLLQRISSLRRQCAIELGMLIQPIRIVDNIILTPNEYCIKIRGNIVAKTSLVPNKVMCVNPIGADIQMQGIHGVEPTFGIEGLWIGKEQIEEAESRGYTILDCTTIITTHLLETIKKYSHELLGRQEVKELLDSMKPDYSVVLEELIPEKMSIGDIQKIFQNLLRENVSIKDRITILETLADYIDSTKDIELLTEYVRISLGRSICEELVDENKTIKLMTLSDELENMVSSSLHKSMNGTFIVLDPNITTNIFKSINRSIMTISFNENKATILVSPKIRAPFRKLIEIVFPNLTVLSLNEIPNDVQINVEVVIPLDSKGEMD